MRLSNASPPGRESGRGAFSRVGFAGIAAILFADGGCTLLRRETEAGESMLQTITWTAGKTDGTNAAEFMQSAVMREADLYAGAVAPAADDFRAKVATTEARNMALQWKLIEAASASLTPRAKISSSMWWTCWCRPPPVAFYVAEDLNALLLPVNQSGPQIAKLSRQGAVDVKEVMNHAFRLGSVLVVVTGMVVLLVVLVCPHLGKRAAGNGCG